VCRKSLAHRHFHSHPRPFRSLYVLIRCYVLSTADRCFVTPPFPVHPRGRVERGRRPSRRREGSIVRRRTQQSDGSGLAAPRHGPRRLGPNCLKAYLIFCEELSLCRAQVHSWTCSYFCLVDHPQISSTYCPKRMSIPNRGTEGEGAPLFLHETGTKLAAPHAAFTRRRGRPTLAADRGSWGVQSSC